MPWLPLRLSLLVTRTTSQEFETVFSNFAEIDIILKGHRDKNNNLMHK